MKVEPKTEVQKVEPAKEEPKVEPQKVEQPKAKKVSRSPDPIVKSFQKNLSRTNSINIFHLKRDTWKKITNISILQGQFFFQKRFTTFPN